MHDPTDSAGDSRDRAALRGQGRLVLVTGRSGAGRSTAIKALEDIGFETIDTPPLRFIPTMAADLIADGKSRLAIGLDARTTGFSVEAVADTLDELRRSPAFSTSMVFLDSGDEALRRRYTETRRRHPLAPNGDLEEGLRRDLARMSPIRAFADEVIDTSAFAPGELKQQMRERFEAADSPGLNVAVISFAYKFGAPAEADFVFDCRFLRNPHYDPDLRPHDGRDPAVADYIAEDPRFALYFKQVLDLSGLVLPACDVEGKSYLTLAFGCSGGRHRSVAMAEAVSRVLAAEGWRIRVKHRELGVGEQRGDAKPGLSGAA